MSPKRSRKPLNDALAEQFIYGEPLPQTVQEPALANTSPESLSEPASISSSEDVTVQGTEDVLSSTVEENSNPSPLFNKLLTPPREATIRLTVDLPTSMHRRLSILAARTGKRKAEIVRVLLDEAVKNIQE